MRYYRYAPLGFAETESQLQALMFLKASRYHDLQIVAVTPEVDYLAKDSGCQYITTEGFYHWDLINKLGEENIDIAEELCDEVDKIINSVARKMPGSDLVSFRALFHPLKGFLDSITIRIVPVETIFKYIRPNTAICFPQSEYKITGPGLLDKPSLSLTSRIVPIVAKTNNCRIEWFQDDNITNDSDDPCSYETKDMDLKNPNDSTADLDIRIELYKQALQNDTSWEALVTDKIMLFSNEGLDNFAGKILTSWSNIEGAGFANIGTLHSANININARIINSIYSDLGQLLWNKVKQNEVIRKLFNIRLIDRYALIEPLLHSLIVNELPRLLLQASVVERNVRNLRKAVIMTGGMIEVNSLIAKACDKYKIPMVSTHRGGYLGYCRIPFHERYEMADADYYICGGPGATETFEKPSPMTRWQPERKRAKPVTLGSVWIDEMVAEYRKKKYQHENVCQEKNIDRFQKRKTIMYVMSALLGDNCYIGYVFHPEIWLYRFQLELINFLAKFPNIDVLLKPPISDRYPQIKSPVMDHLSKQDIQNIQVFSQDIALEKCIHLADAFIIDSPSTPVWPLVSTEKPFLAYIDKSFFSLVPKVIELLRKRAIFADTKDGFFENLNNFLHTYNWTLHKPVNDEFLCHYGTYLNDGNSHKRVTEFLFKLANENNRQNLRNNNEHFNRNCQYALEQNC
jgi:hypothetical protein